MISESDRKRVEGATHGRYAPVEGPFGGLSGVVFKAIDTRSDKVVAIKLPSDADLMKWRASARMIAREARALEAFEQFLLDTSRSDPRWQVVHEHVAHLHDQGQVLLREAREAGPYLVTEWAQGRVLQDILNEEGAEKRLPQGTILRILNAVAALLEVAHQLGFANRDVDAKQIFWDSRGGEGRGIARPYLKMIDWANAEFFEPGSGSPVPKEDLRQFGELMLQLCVGSTTLKAEVGSAQQIERLIDAKGEVAVRATIGEMIAKCLELNGGYPTAGALHQDLNQLLQEFEAPLRQSLSEALKSFEAGNSEQAAKLVLQVQEQDPANEKAGELESRLREARRIRELQGLKQAAWVFLENENWDRARRILHRAQALAEGSQTSEANLLCAIADLGDALGENDVAEVNALIRYLKCLLGGDKVGKPDSNGLLELLLHSPNAEMARHSKLVRHLLNEAGRRLLRDDLKALLSYLEQPATGSHGHWQRLAAECKDQLGAAANDLLGLTGCDPTQYRMTYSKLLDVLDVLPDSMRDAKGIGGQQAHLLRKHVAEVVDTLGRVIRAGEECDWSQVETLYDKLYRLDADNTFFHDQSLLMKDLVRIDREIDGASIKPPAQRRVILEALLKEMDGIAANFPCGATIEQTRQRIERHLTADLTPGFDFLSQGQIAVAEEFVQRMRLQLGHSFELDCLEALIRGTQCLFHATYFPNSEHGEAYYLEQAQRWADSAKKVSGEHQEPQALVGAIEGYGHLINPKQNLPERIKLAEKAYQALREAMPGVPFALLLSRALEQDVQDARRWWDSLVKSLGHVQKQNWAEAGDCLEQVQADIPHRLEKAEFKGELFQWRRVAAGMEKALNELGGGHYESARQILLEVQQTFPPAAKSDPAYGPLREMIERALKVANMPAELDSLAKHMAKLGRHWKAKAFQEIERPLQQLASAEKEFVKQPYSRLVLSRYQRIAKELVGGDQEAVAAELDKIRVEAPDDPFIEPYQALFLMWTMPLHQRLATAVNDALAHWRHRPDGSL